MADEYLKGIMGMQIENPSPSTGVDPRDEIARLKRETATARNMMVASDERATQAEAQAAACVGALEYFQKNGCPICSGDCASANPPVLFCPMQALATLPARAKALAKMPEVLDDLFTLMDAVVEVRADRGKKEHYAKIMDTAEIMKACVEALAAYRTEPASVSETETGTEKRT